jgi:hypothetical protein
VNPGTDPLAAEALFGSAARRDSDTFSDLDYLIVGETSAQLGPRKRWLTAQGFSVSDYTWRRLERCFNDRTLFALHLTLEARIVFDRANRLRDLFQSFRPKSRYTRDYEDSLQLFCPLECVPDSSIGRAWALDTLAVAFRNSAILSFADEGVYLFSMAAILSELKKRGRITEEQVGTLSLLRLAKAKYRADVNEHIGKDTLANALRAVQSALKLDVSSTEGTLSRLTDAHSKSISTYARMRSIEAELISVPAHAIRHFEAAQIRSELLRAVKNPHAYLWQFVHNAREVDASLSRLRAFY